MICLKCGNEISDNEQICKNCGYNKNNLTNEDNAYATVNRGIYNTNPVDPDKAGFIQLEQKHFDEMLQMYIGPKYYNFKKGSFSWCAFFFGPIYFLYRKLYLTGITVHIINVLLFIFSSIINLNFVTYSVLQLIFSLFQGIIFKKYYFHESIEQVAKIRYNNKNKGINELCDIAKSKGGTNGTIIGIIICTISLISIITSTIIINDDELLKKIETYYESVLKTNKL